MNEAIDIRHVLPTIGVPTLVLYRASEYLREGTRFMGARIPRATVVELPGNEHLPWEGDQEAVLDEIERFLSGARDEVELDRVLATLLFVEVVDAAATAPERDLVARYEHVVRVELARFRGRRVEGAGNGSFAIFDGPARAVRCASAIVDAGRKLGLGVRAGLHTGEIEQEDGGARGTAVQIGAGIVATAGPGEVLVSSTVKDIVAGSGITFEERGERHLAGSGVWHLYLAVP
jgi:class 3 adenylate cyclase